MKKNEIVMIVGLLVVSALIFVMVWFNNQNKTTICVKDDQNAIVLEVPLNENGVYEVEGANGLFHLEVKDEKFRAVDVDCPDHVCENVGWVSKDFYQDIICLPNRLWVSLNE